MATSPLASLQRAAPALLVQYALYHRDRRNIVTHFIGIPMIVFSIGVLLARGNVSGISMAWIVWALASMWYLTRGNLVLGLATSLVNGVLIFGAHPLAGGSTGSWLAWGLGSFALGWVIQFVGHYYEGRKPAFVDDIVGLLVGPMFVVAEWMFAAGWAPELLAEIEAQAGPTMLRDLAQPASR